MDVCEQIDLYCYFKIIQQYKTTTQWGKPSILTFFTIFFFSTVSSIRTNTYCRNWHVSPDPTRPAQLRLFDNWDLGATLSYFIIYIYFFSFLSYFWGRGGLSWLGLGQFSKPWKRKVKKFQSSTTIELHSRRRLLCLTSLGYCLFLLLLLLVVVLRVNNFCLFPMIILNMFKNLCWTFFFPVSGGW